MLKIHIYLLLIAFFIVSCSDSSGDEKIVLSEAIKGDWLPSSEKIIESSKITTDKSKYWIPEIKEKNASRVSKNTIYSFKDAGELNIYVLSELNQTLWEKEGTWDLSDSLLVISVEGEGKQRFKLQSLSEKEMVLQNKSTSDKIFFNRKEESATE